MNADFYARAARDLPNFPPDVIQLWFEHAENAGWPPQINVAGFPVGTWARVLGDRRPLAFWPTVTWTLTLLPMSPALLEPDSAE